ncbi:MAG TPA: glycosyltransferase family 9 protein, partial [Clostridia bacterium]|nr:glycosyltransferase family 9 protein [Clostridia bacterium]
MADRFVTRLKFLGKLVLDEPERIARQALFFCSGVVYPRYKRASVILPCSGGMGDNLMLTCVAREIRRRNQDTWIHVLTRMPAIFERNPDIDFVSLCPRGMRSRLRPFHVRYHHDFPWKEHFLETMCRCVGIKSNIQFRTYIYPEEKDYAFADRVIAELGDRPVLLARSAGKHGGFRKLWPINHWAQTVERLGNSVPVLDVGGEGLSLQVGRKNYRSLLGGTTVHQLAALMSRARALITVDTGPNHLASAFGLPTVCILGGVFPPEAIRYPYTRVLVNRPACCDCWPEKECTQNLKCLNSISVDEVLAALAEVLEGGRQA